MKACPEDVVFVKEIEIECGLSAWTAEDYLQEVNANNNYFLTVRNRETVIGFILARLIMNNNCLLDEFEDEFDIEIYNLAVKKEFRREKIATSLINRVIKMGKEKNACKVHLEVRESNKEGINFYRRNLFNIIGKRPNFYSNPTENGILMCRDLA